jgi:Holliday junction DNA helicase RuvA
MIERISGVLVKKSSGEAVIDCSGVGYLAFISLNTSEALPDEGSAATLLTVLVHREDAMLLYGFSNESERSAFKMLTQISGIGPKIALSILSSLDLAELRHHVLTNNVVAIRKIPGIGAKSAERLVLELRDKITKIEIADSALVTLGYNNATAEKAIRKALAENGNDLSAEVLIRKALKFALM